MFADFDIPAIAALDISVRVGACEQNVMGIRQRSPLCRDVFDLLLSENVDEEPRRALVRCLDEEDFIGGREDAEAIGDCVRVASEIYFDDEAADGEDSFPLQCFVLPDEIFRWFEPTVRTSHEGLVKLWIVGQCSRCQIEANRELNDSEDTSPTVVST